MHFMVERIFMNQEIKVINVHLEKKDMKDFLIFEFDDAMGVCLNNEDSQNDLKKVFVKILQELIESPIKLNFVDKSEYNTGLYIDVCKEYIKDLNKEIESTRKNIPEKLKLN